MLRNATSGSAGTLIGAMCLCALTGCAVVKTVGADGREEVRVQPMMSEVLTASDAGPQLIKVTTLGISTTSRGVDVGLREEDIVLAPASCHAVLVVRTDAQAETAAKLARHVNESCIVQR